MKEAKRIVAPEWSGDDGVGRRGGKYAVPINMEVPEPQLTTRQIVANRHKIENEIKRKKLQLRNTKKLVALAEYEAKVRTATLSQFFLLAAFLFFDVFLLTLKQIKPTVNQI